MNQRRKISAHSTTRRNTIPLPGSTIVRIKATAAAVISIAETAVTTVEEIVAETVVGAGVGAVEVVVAAVVAAEVGAQADLAAETCLHRNMLRHKAETARIAAATKIVAIVAAMIGVARVAILEVIGRKAAGMANRVHRQRLLGRQKRRFCSRANLSQNSAIARRLQLRLLP